MRLAGSGDGSNHFGSVYWTVGERRGIAGSGCNLPVQREQVRTDGVHVDGTVQVASAIEVVFEIERQVVTEVVLNREVRLVGVSENKILADRESEGLQR